MKTNVSKEKKSNYYCSRCGQISQNNVCKICGGKVVDLNYPPYSYWVDWKTQKGGGGDGETYLRIEVCYDGACGPINPGGHAACGVVIRCDGQTLWQESRYIGSGPEMSNNVAEYGGIIAALEYLLQAELSRHPVILRGDSMLSVRQMSGEWRVRRGLYLPYWQRARELASQFPNISFAWIPREENTEADTLSKAGLKELEIQKERR